MQQSQLLIGLQGVVYAPVQQIRRQGIRPGLAHHSGLDPESRQLPQKTVTIKVVANEGHKKITALKRAAVGADPTKGHIGVGKCPQRRSPAGDQLTNSDGHPTDLGSNKIMPLPTRAERPRSVC